MSALNLCCRLIFNTTNLKTWVPTVQILRINSGYSNHIGNEDLHIYRCIKGDSKVPELNRFSRCIEEKAMQKDEFNLLIQLAKAKRNCKQSNFQALVTRINPKFAKILIDSIKREEFDFDKWFELSLSLIKLNIRPRYLNPLLGHMTRQDLSMFSNEQVKHILFLTVINRNHLSLLHLLESRILGILGKASFEDVTLICTAFFKNQKIVDNADILEKIIDITKKNVPIIDFHQPGYNSVVKCLRYSCRNILDNPKLRDHLVELIKTILDNSTRKGIFTSTYNATQTIKLMESCRIYNRKLLDKILATMFRRLDDYRIKDIQYLLTSSSFFHHQEAKIDDQFQKNLDRLSNTIVSRMRDDDRMLPYHIVPLIRALATFNYYNEDLIDYTNRLFDDNENLEKLESTLEFERNVLLLYVATRLEGCEVPFLQNRDQIVNQISTKIDRSISKVGDAKNKEKLYHLSNGFLSNQHKSMPITESALAYTQLLSRTDELSHPPYKFHLQYLMPHENFSNLVVSKSCQSPEIFDSKTLMPEKVPKNQKRCLIHYVKEYDFVTPGSHLLSGNKLFVTRLYKKLGYHVIHANISDTNIVKIAREIKSILDS